MNTTRIDTVVVGAGLAGLATARTLQQQGVCTLVLEGHPPGGRARSDVHDGFVFNRGPHALYRNGPAEHVLAGLGIHPTGGPPTTRAYGLRDGRVGLLPGSASTLLRTPLLSVRGKLAIARFQRQLAAARPAALGSVTVNEWLDTLGLPDDARDVVLMLIRVSTYGDAPDAMSADVAVEQMQLALSAGVRYLDDGWQSMVDALATGLTIERCQAVAIVRDGGHIEVHGGNDRLIVASAVVVAVGTPKASAGVLGRDAYDVGPPVELACLDLGVRQPPRHLAMFGLDDPLYLSTHCPPARLAPDGQSVVHVARYLDGAHDAAPEVQRAELEALAQTAGVASDDIAASRYLHRMVGVGALPTASRGGLAGRPTVDDTGIDGVFLAGDWVGRVGHLADASLASGVEAATRAAAAVGATR